MNSKLIYLIMRGLGLFLKEFKTNLLSLISLITLILVYYIFYTTSIGVIDFLTHISKTNSIRIYIKSDDSSSKEVIKKSILETTGITNIKYYSKKDAKEFIISNSSTISSLENFSDEFFPAFIEVIPTNMLNKDIFNNIEKQVKKLPFVENISYGKEFVSKFTMISRSIITFLSIISILFTITISVIIYNIVKLSLYKFKDEVQLYSLVGATRPFIYTPYIFSSLLQIFTGYILSSTIFILFFSLFNNKLLQPSGVNIFQVPNILYFINIFIFISILTIIASIISIVSFLKKVPLNNEN